MNTQWVYSACERCTAKWFARAREPRCPRCGGCQVLHTHAAPPWLASGPHRQPEIEESAAPADSAARARNGEQPGPTSMIMLGAERLIAISELPALLPRRKNGKRVHVSVCYRWISRGIGPNKQKLAAVRIGRTMYTSWEALQRFGQHLGPSTVLNAVSSIVSPAQKTRRDRNAAQRVAEELGPSGSRS